MRASGQRSLHHGGFAAIDRYRRARPGQALDDRLDARNLIAFPDHRCAGPRGFAANVDKGSAMARHVHTRSGCRLGIVDEPPPIREAVRRDVEDAHDVRLIEAQHTLAHRQRGARAGQIPPDRGGAVFLVCSQRVNGRRHRRRVDQAAGPVLDPLNLREPQHGARQPLGPAVMALRTFNEGNGADIKGHACSASFACCGRTTLCLRRQQIGLP